ncbi:BQ5605_C025g10078 [Microbotryum silenes-dioicae]|uniref:BQ5605_C025g10078 protein n=1 Tax=Microbotryum silenes-dioicae TaxID=796604 RepID=A0A2X0N8P5_9BASI|nr:BQ5605_C025g10078 [Microbotryum silenes-dioicae]
MMNSLNLLEDLALDWRLATNDRPNTDKTVVLPIGLAGTLVGNAQSSSSPQASRSSASASPSTPAGTRNCRLRESRRTAPDDVTLEAVPHRWLTHHTRAFYVNRYAIPKVLHFLAADNPAALARGRNRCSRTSSADASVRHDYTTGRKASSHRRTTSGTLPRALQNNLEQFRADLEQFRHKARVKRIQPCAARLL